MRIPNLYGVTAGMHNLTGFTSTQVASFFLSLLTPATMADAEVLTTALNVYATTLSVGGTAGQAAGFTVDAAGLGARSWNVGSFGLLFGVPTDTTLNVYQLLLASNAQAVAGKPWNGNGFFDLLAFIEFNALNAMTAIG